MIRNSITYVNWSDFTQDGTPFFYGISYSSWVVGADTNLYLGYTTEFASFEQFSEIFNKHIPDWYDVTHNEWTFIASFNSIIKRFMRHDSLTSNLSVYIYSPKDKAFQKADWLAILKQKGS